MSIKFRNGAVEWKIEESENAIRRDAYSLSVLCKEQERFSRGVQLIVTDSDGSRPINHLPFEFYDLISNCECGNISIKNGPRVLANLLFHKVNNCKFLEFNARAILDAIPDENLIIFLLAARIRGLEDLRLEEPSQPRRIVAKRNNRDVYVIVGNSVSFEDCESINYGVGNNTKITFIPINSRPKKSTTQKIPRNNSNVELRACVGGVIFETAPKKLRKIIDQSYSETNKEYRLIPKNWHSSKFKKLLNNYNFSDARQEVGESSYSLKMLDYNEALLVPTISEGSEPVLIYLSNGIMRLYFQGSLKCYKDIMSKEGEIDFTKSAKNMGIGYKDTFLIPRILSIKDSTIDRFTQQTLNVEIFNEKTGEYVTPVFIDGRFDLNEEPLSSSSRRQEDEENERKNIIERILSGHSNAKLNIRQHKRIKINQRRA